MFNVLIRYNIRIYQMQLKQFDVTLFIRKILNNYNIDSKNRETQ